MFDLDGRDDSYEKENLNKRGDCQTLKSKLGDSAIINLCDSGSQITCISEELAKKISYNVKRTLPVTNVALSRAFDKKLVHVKKQICVDIEVGKLKIQTILLVNPKLI